MFNFDDQTAYDRSSMVNISLDGRFLAVNVTPNPCPRHVCLITGGNVVRGNRTVMQMKYLRDHPDMSYGSNKQLNQQCE